MTRRAQSPPWKPCNSEQQKAIKRELGMLRAGIRGENESAYFLGFHFKDTKNTVLIHDLRLEHNGRVAQIDHLLLTRPLDFWILETKHFSSGLKIDEQDQFLRWNNWQKCYEGMPSPLEQAERQGIVLRDLISSLDWPTRAGIRLMPTIKPRVLISPNARLDIPKRHGKAADATLKADVFMTHWKAEVDKEGVLATLASAAKIVAPETLVEMARMLIACHRPHAVDYAAKFGMQNVAPASAPAVAEAPSNATPATSHSCKHCHASDLEMVHGKYGYYFKCRSCAKNTPPPYGCEKKGCSSRIRKAGQEFTQYCEACGWDRPLYTNPA
jgi:hypothetical protein